MSEYWNGFLDGSLFMLAFLAVEFTWGFVTRLILLWKRDRKKRCIEDLV